MKLPLLVAAGISIGAALASCSAAQNQAIATVGADTLVCVLNHDTDPPITIVAECGVPDIATVIAILDAEHAAMVRAQTRDAGK